MNGCSNGHDLTTIDKCENEDAKFMRKNFGEKWIKRIDFRKENCHFSFAKLMSDER